MVVVISSFCGMCSIFKEGAETVPTLHNIRGRGTQGGKSCRCLFLGPIKPKKWFVIAEFTLCFPSEE